MQKLTINLSCLCTLCMLLFASASDAHTLSWTNVCDFNWQDSKVEMNGDGAISPLELTTTKKNYQQPIQVWCDAAPNDQSTSGQLVGIIINSQSTPGTLLALSPQQRSLSNNTLPIKLCLGKSNATQLCQFQTNDKRTYKWGGNSKVSLASLMFVQTSTNDPKYGDKCRSGKGEEWCAGLWGYRGPYTNTLVVHFVTDPLAIAKAPPAPGKYRDTISVTINGNVGTGKGGIVYPSAVDFSGQNHPTITLTAVLVPDCRIDSAPDVSMNGSFSSQLSQEQQIGVTCTNTTPYTMSFTGANDITGWHQMKSETNDDMLRYQIYKDAAHTQLWSNTNSLTGTGLEQTYKLFYATDPSQANLPAGTYQDTETLTVSY